MTVTHGYQPPSTSGVPGPPPGPPSYGWAPPEPPRRGRGMAVALSVVGLLAITAIGLSIVSLAKSPESSPTAPTNSASPTSSPGVDTAAATHNLCTAVGPLVAQTDQIANTWMGLGPVGTPARDSGTSKFVTDMTGAVARIQKVLDSHPDADPFLRRSLQRGIDDQLMIAADVSTGPFEPYDQNTWLDRQSSYAGVLSVCSKAGVTW